METRITEKNVTIKKILNSEYAAIFLLLFIFLLAGPFIPRFFSGNNLLNLMTRTAIIASAAIGMTFVILTGGIDLSMGGILVLVAYIGTETLVKTTGMNIWLAAILMICMGGFMGAVNGFNIVGLGMPPFIATLIMMNITRGIAHFVYEAKTIYGLPVAYSIFGQGKILGFPVPLLILLCVLLLAFYILKYTVFGRWVYAVGSNLKAAWLAGIEVNRVKYLVYTISGLAAGLASVMLSSRLSSVVSSLGQGFELDVIAAVVIGGTSLFGGTGGVLGSVVGAFVIETVSNMLNLIGVSPFLELIAKGSVLWLAVLIDMIKKGYVFKKPGD